MDATENYLDSIKKLFRYYKQLGDKALQQISEEQMHWKHHERCNSIAVMVKHMAGNSLSRWTDFLHTDGEKPWRNRDDEFKDTFSSKAEMLDRWNEGWACLFKAVDPLAKEDAVKIIYIRNEGHTVTEAINRQLAHLAYHVGQIVFTAKMLAPEFQSLSIPKGQSVTFNNNKFSGEKTRTFFTDAPQE